MKATWQELQKRFKGEFVGGDLICKVKGKRQSIGKKVQGKVKLNHLGEQLSLEPVPPVKDEPAAPARKRIPVRKKSETPDAQA